ncbi:MAG: hypothetical protein Ct9H90mP30_2410 [Actinomycetota bacterium]|nr:MAG: hypothetical protein Ct9H90mP30_2410 [Actinomycetota bacterium]
MKKTAFSGVFSLVNEITNIGWRPLYMTHFSGERVEELGFDLSLWGAPAMRQS